MGFQETLAAHFPTAMPQGAYMEKTYEILQGHGFTGPNTIACVGVCRDEITSSFVDSVYTTWGEAFGLGSLAGMLFAGKTGFLAAQHHAPDLEGPPRYAFYAMAHIGISSDGQIGRCNRPGKSGLSSACGALVALRNEIAAGRLSTEFDPDDPEQSLLKQRLMKRIRYGEVPPLVALTRLAHDVIREDLDRMLALTVDSPTASYAALTGIQIHGPDGIHLVAPGSFRLLAEQKSYDLLSELE